MSDNSPKKILLAQARAMGMEIDGRWSVDTLAEKVAEQQEINAEIEHEELLKSCDTWIYAIRDCFVGTEKQLAGTAFQAPKALYARWKEVGAARLADEDEVAEAQAEAA